MMDFVKYPRTPHVEGSRLQPGDHDLHAVPFAQVRGHLVIEEKLDGANVGICFDHRGALQLQSRGHVLVGGHRERHFDLLKTWAARHRDALWRALGQQYLLFGEWLFAKHTIFYDALPHYLLEFDVFDRANGEFLDTTRRRALLAGTPVRSVPVVHDGEITTLAGLQGLVARSLYKTDAWRERLRVQSDYEGHDPDRAAQETDPSELAEGLYIKREHGGRVVGRYKFVRASFLGAVLDSGSHWLARPIVPNALAPGVDLFAEMP